MTVDSDHKGAEEFLSGKLAQVNVARIEKELSGLWKTAAHGDVDACTAAVVRAVSFNLILLTDEADAEQKCSDLLDEIESVHPCRSILAIFRDGQQHNLSAWVSARCHTSGSSKQICSEQITVSCEGGRPEELASVVLPLILPDLPVFVWWRQHKVSWDELTALHACARRFILDSGRDAFDPAIFKDAYQLIQSNSGCLYVSDLNWRRLHGWCRAFADSFDGFPVPLALLNKISRVNITFNGESTVSNRVLLFTGWMAARLGWQPKEIDLKRGAKFQTKGGAVEVIFTPDKDNLSPGHIREIQVDFAGDNRQLVISPERTAEARFIIARLAGSEENEATRVSNVLSEAVLVGQELEVLGADPIYEASVAMVSKMVSVRK
ncbi:MAG TPA: glucose-6-phosphate dehydrogenase assembly protein OpcA [Candidatus Obscuribacterales bacterium]